MLWRAGHMVSANFLHALFKAEGLMQTRRAPKAELNRSAELFELLPTRPNVPWRSDVTYNIHMSGHGSWHAVTTKGSLRLRGHACETWSRPPCRYSMRRCGFQVTLTYLVQRHRKCA